MPKTIKVVEENIHGHDYVIGDVHGAEPCLHYLLKSTFPEDRLFIVGDLTDRGPFGDRVIRLINQAEYRDRVFVVRGNHEQLCLQTIGALETIGYLFDDSKESFTVKLDGLFHSNKISPSTRHRISHHANNNKGLWLGNLFLKEIKEGKIRFAEDEPHEVTYGEDSEIKRIKEYMEALPHIIHVAGKKPFNMVHADMPVSDSELRRMIQQEEELSEEDQWYAQWARAEGRSTKIREVGRSKVSVVTYVGHSVIGSSGQVPSVRYETNTINLDIEMHARYAALVVNHTEGEAFIDGPSVKTAEGLNYMKIAQATTSRHLKIQHQLAAFLEAVIGSDRVEAIIQQFAKKIFPEGEKDADTKYTAIELLDYAYNNEAINEEQYQQLRATVASPKDSTGAVLEALGGPGSMLADESSAVTEAPSPAVTTVISADTETLEETTDTEDPELKPFQR